MNITINPAIAAGVLASTYRCRLRVLQCCGGEPAANPGSKLERNLVCAFRIRGDQLYGKLVLCCLCRAWLMARCLCVRELPASHQSAPSRSTLTLHQVFHEGKSCSGTIDE